MLNVQKWLKLDETSAEGIDVRSESVKTPWLREQTKKPAPLAQALVQLSKMTM